MRCADEPEWKPILEDVREAVTLYDQADAIRALTMVCAERIAEFDTEEERQQWIRAVGRKLPEAVKLVLEERAAAPAKTFGV